MGVALGAVVYLAVLSLVLAFMTEARKISR